MSVIQIDLRFTVILIKVSVVFFFLEIDKLILKFIWKGKAIEYPKRLWKRKNGHNHFLMLRPMGHGFSNQNIVVLGLGKQ